jgi:hypothetical protein
VTYSSSGSVGDTNWVSGGSVGFQSGHVLHDMNTSIPDASPPYSSGSPIVNGTISYGGTNYAYTLSAASNYVSGNFTISSGGAAMIVTNNATLYVTDDFTISGSGFIYLAPGASLALYVGTTNASGNDKITISGGGVGNGTREAANFSIIGLPSVKTVTYSGSAKFIGTLYAPSAALTMSGGSEASGALVANTISLSGGMSFHYDDCLGGNPSDFLKYIVSTWREL